MDGLIFDLNFGVKKEFDRSKIVYIPYMTDHGYALLGALENLGIKAIMLPMSDEKSLELGRKFAEGGECLPFILTTGDFIKLATSPLFDPQSSVLFMPTSCGPCRFGQYHNAQKLILKKLGYDVEFVSLEAYDSYSLKDLGIKFRRLVWCGVIAIEFLQKLLWKKRPYEVNKGQTEEIYHRCLLLIKESMAKGGIKGLLKILPQCAADFEKIKIKREERPRIGIIGEVYIRTNEFSNADIVRMLEQLGGECRVAPISEWFYYTNYKNIQEFKEKREFLKVIKLWAKDLVQVYDDRRLSKLFGNHLEESDLKEPKTLELVKNSDPYIKDAYRGEPVLDIGKAVDYALKGADGIVNVLPFSCMPGTMVTSVTNLVRKDYNNIPWINLSFDGQRQTNLKTRLEAFIFQAKKFRSSHKLKQKSEE